MRERLRGPGLEALFILFEIMQLADANLACIFDLWVPYNFVYSDENAAYLRVKGCAPQY